MGGFISIFQEDKLKPSYLFCFILSRASGSEDIPCKVEVVRNSAHTTIRAKVLYNYTVSQFFSIFNRGKNTKKTGLRNTVLMCNNHLAPAAGLEPAT